MYINLIRTNFLIKVLLVFFCFGLLFINHFVIICPIIFFLLFFDYSSIAIRTYTSESLHLLHTLSFLLVLINVFFTLSLRYYYLETSRLHSLTIITSNFSFVCYSHAFLLFSINFLTVAFLFFFCL